MCQRLKASARPVVAAFTVILLERSERAGLPRRRSWQRSWRKRLVGHIAVGGVSLRAARWRRDLGKSKLWRFQRARAFEERVDDRAHLPHESEAGKQPEQAHGKRDHLAKILGRYSVDSRNTERERQVARAVRNAVGAAAHGHKAGAEGEVACRAART